MGLGVRLFFFGWGVAFFGMGIWKGDLCGQAAVSYGA